MKHLRRTSSGFSLLELSMVLVIASVLVSFGITLGTDAIKGSDKMTTLTRMNTVQSALNAYVKAFGYLPCPSSRALAPSSASFGIEARDGTHVACTTDSGLTKLSADGIAPFIYTGAVPVRTLGLPDAYAADAWGNKFTYAVSAYHVASVGSYATIDGPITIMAGDRTGTSYAVTTARGVANANAPGPGAVYVIVSHGADGKGAWPLNGTAIGTACATSGANDGENCDTSNPLVFYDTTFNDGSQVGAYFDDYVVWGSNMLDRVATSNSGAGRGSGCTSATGCQPWCATCTADPTNATYTVCQRTITSTSPCQALCVYSYPTINIGCP